MFAISFFVYFFIVVDVVDVSEWHFYFCCFLFAFRFLSLPFLAVLVSVQFFNLFYLLQLQSIYLFAGLVCWQSKD